MRLLPLLTPLFVLLLGTGAPDEGQWLPQQFISRDWAELKSRGLELTKDEFWNPERGGLLSAAVQINGCSATLVSPKGLVVTNHHCAFGAIQRASSVEENFVDNGFLASSMEDEIRAQGMTLRVVRRIENVTDRIHAAAAEATDDLDRLRRVEEAQAALKKEGEASAPDTECSIASFFNGREYHMYYRTLIRDVRLVYAPPRSVGEFGGEVDNWEWPRHTGDFAFLRAYVGPDGRPAQYSRDNKPYEPDHWIKISGTGVSEGDLVMILGYPGSTDRYLTSLAVKTVEEQLYPLRNRFFTEFIRILERHAEGNPRRALQLSSNIKSLANAQKNALGMVKGLARNDVVAQKQAQEKAFVAWVDEDPVRSKLYGSVLEEVLKLDREDAATRQRDFLLSATVRNCQFLNILIDLVSEVEGRMDSTPWGDIQKGAARFGRPLTDQVEWLEKPMLAFVIDELNRLPDGQELPGQADVIGGMGGAAWVEMAFSDTALTEGEARTRLFLEGRTAARGSDEPLLRLARILAPEMAALRQRARLQEARRLVVGQAWIEAQQAWRGKAFYPDANGTLRVSVASVKGYEPKDGIQYLPQTTLRGVIDKHTGEAPFDNPADLLAAAKENDRGRFADPALGDVPICFLSDGDTTGGNSGSGVINGKGELVGLNFDRVFENVAGDYGWNAARSRNISVDIRYVLWILEKVRPAPRLLEELGL